MYGIKNLLAKETENEKRKPSVTVIGRKVIVDDALVDLDLVGPLFQGVMRDLDKAKSRITRGLSDSDPAFQIALPSMFLDRPNDQSVDFWFGCLPSNGFTGRDDVMLNALVNHEVFADFCFLKSHPSGIIINPEGCHQLFQMCFDFRLLIFVAAHIGSGAPPRGPETTSQTLRNKPGGRIRNLQVIDGRLCFVGGYNKTEAIVSASLVPCATASC